MPQRDDEHGESLNVAANATSRALFVHGGALGDFILSLRIVEALRQNGATHVSLLGKPQYGRLAAQRNGINEIIDFDAHGAHALFSAEDAIPAALVDRLASHDFAVDTLGGHLPRRLCEIGVSRVVSIDPRPRPEWRNHITEQWLADLRAAGLAANPGPPRINIAALEELPTDARDSAFAVPVPNQYVVIQPGSGGAKKCWPLDGYVSLARHLHTDNLQSVFLLGPVECECIPEAERLTLRREFTVIENPSLPHAAHLIAAARLYVGNDSGITHLAAAVGTPTVAVFGPTSPDLWRPLGDRVTTIAPSLGRAWPETDRVIGAAEEALRSQA